MEFRNIMKKYSYNKNNKCIDCSKLIRNKSKRCKSCALQKREITNKTRQKISKLKEGPNHPMFKGKVRNANNYIMIWSPNHPHKNSSNYILEHRLVMEKHLGRYLKPEEVVHHINGIRDDNRIENLILFPNRKAHFNFIHLNKKTFICKYCQKDQRK